MIKRFNNIVIHPNYGQCPLWEGDEAKCNDCSYCDYIGTLGGEYFVDCTAINEEEEDY